MQTVNARVKRDQQLLLKLDDDLFSLILLMLFFLTKRECSSRQAKPLINDARAREYSNELEERDVFFSSFAF